MVEKKSDFFEKDNIYSDMQPHTLGPKTKSIIL